eukprot:2619571-Ditylum_brightwellii.AAC.1
MYGKTRERGNWMGLLIGKGKHFVMQEVAVDKDGWKKDEDCSMICVSRLTDYESIHLETGKEFEESIKNRFQKESGVCNTVSNNRNSSDSGLYRKNNETYTCPALQALIDE